MSLFLERNKGIFTYLLFDKKSRNSTQDNNWENTHKDKGVAEQNHY